MRFARRGIHTRLVAVRFDSTDLKILRLLSQDGRKSYREIAKLIGVSPGTVRNRINQMRSHRLITFDVRLNYRVLGFGVHAALLLKVQPGERSDIADALSVLEETGDVATLAGRYDLLVHVFCRDVPHLLEFIDKSIHSLNGVTQVSMNLVVKTKQKADPSFLDNLEVNIDD